MKDRGGRKEGTGESERGILREQEKGGLKERVRKWIRLEEKDWEKCMMDGVVYFDWNREKGVRREGGSEERRMRMRLK